MEEKRNENAIDYTKYPEGFQAILEIGRAHV